MLKVLFQEIGLKFGQLHKYWDNYELDYPIMIFVIFLNKIEGNHGSNYHNGSSFCCL
jgi:hypothetical protein